MKIQSAGGIGEAIWQLFKRLIVYPLVFIAFTIALGLLFCKAFGLSIILVLPFTIVVVYIACKFLTG